MSNRYWNSARVILALSLIAAAASCSKAPEPATTATSMASEDTMATAQHGAYLATITGCHDCHTPDQETGIGIWSEDDIVRALQTGKRPDGSDLRPPMPWPDFAHMTPRDVHSIAKYLKSLVPVTHKVPDAIPPGQKSKGAALALPPPPAWDAPKGAPKS
jgi:mono/diheme cytochrome c family protein